MITHKSTDGKSDKNYILLVFYDGNCGICNKFVMSILKLKPKKNVKFISYQSDRAKFFLSDFNINDMTTIRVFYAKRVFIKSKAIILILENCRTKIPFLKYLNHLPIYLLDIAYDIFAKNRYRFSKSNLTCRHLSEEELSYFNL